ncbi:MAG: ABC transporter ATP-binding protein [Proteobacteria bacterium]|jgi:peptide/nickel transport system ATP-binding protein|nr:ABC transporter ATP-binding protein [Pseudomonadota bacterium]
MVLRIENLSVKLPKGGDREFAIEDVTLHVDRGEIVCVVGESGSGKSVTAFTIMGLIPRKELTPVQGKILLENEDLLTKDNAEMRKYRGSRMGMIFQEPMTALNPVMKVGKQIEELLTIHTNLKETDRKRKILEAMNSVKLPEPEKIFNTYPHQLSGGQRQRIMIAMSLALEPSLLIADEPTTALDVTTQAEVLSLIREIQQSKGMGVLFITHDFGVVAEIADRVIVMQNGRVVEEGTRDKILHAPEHIYTKMLISSVPSLTPPDRSQERTQKTKIVDILSLSKTYGYRGFFGSGRVVNAVQDVSLELFGGELVGIVGESGSGKSTLARCLVRLIDPTSGDITIDGRNISTLSRGSLRPYRSEFQIVFQDPYRSLNPRRTIEQSLIEGPMNFGLSQEEAKSRAKEILTIVGISPEAMSRFPHQFSGGQRQRICIARAIVMEPKLIVADEAVSALDVSVQKQVLDLFLDIRQRFSLAMLFITHDLRVAAQICDRVIVMQHGKIVEQGRTTDVYNNPQHQYTKDLLAAAPGRDVKFSQL